MVFGNAPTFPALLQFSLNTTVIGLISYLRPGGERGGYEQKWELERARRGGPSPQRAICTLGWQYSLDSSASTTIPSFKGCLWAEPGRPSVEPDINQQRKAHRTHSTTQYSETLFLIPECVWILSRNVITLSSFCLTHIYHNPPAKKILRHYHKGIPAYKSKPVSYKKTSLCDFSHRQSGKQTEGSMSVPLIRQAWVIKEEIRRSVWERPSEPLLIYSQLIVLGLLLFPAKLADQRAASQWGASLDLLRLEQLGGMPLVASMAKG